MWKPWKTNESKDDLAKLTEQMRELEGRMKSIETEWANTYVQIKRLTGHITKAAAIDRKQNSENSNSNSDSHSPDGTSTGDRIVGTHERLQTMRARHGVLPR